MQAMLSFIAACAQVTIAVMITALCHREERSDVAISILDNRQGMRLPHPCQGSQLSPE